MEENDEEIPTRSDTRKNGISKIVGQKLKEQIENNPVVVETRKSNLKNKLRQLINSDETSNERNVLI